MNVLVTGAAGLLGHRVIQPLLNVAEYAYAAEGRYEAQGAYEAIYSAALRSSL